MIYFWLFILFSAMCRAIKLIAIERRETTLLPAFMVSINGPLRFDGFSIAAFLQRSSMLIAGAVWGYHHILEITSLDYEFMVWQFVVIWFVSGNLFSLFYHTLFMKKEHRTFGFVQWYRDLVDLIKSL